MMRDLGNGAHIGMDEMLDLVNGLGSASEREAWLRHARACPQCESQWRAMSETHELARLEAGKLGTLPSPRLERLPPHVERRRAFWPLVAGVAATAAVIAIAILARPAGPRSGLVGHLLPLPTEVELTTLRGGAQSSDDLLRSGLRAYARHDYAGAARAFGGNAAAGAAGTMQQVYLASSLAFLGQHREVVRILDGVPEAQVPFPWRSEIGWTRCIAEIGMGNQHTADSLLAVLAGRSSADRERADALRRFLANRDREP
jgi:hypothetical protein